MNPRINEQAAQFDCTFRLNNHLDNCWHNWFEGLTVKDLSNGQVLLSGSVPDQAAMFGLLNRIRDLNLKVISLSVRTKP